MKTVIIAGGFAAWCGLVLAAPFVAFGAGLLSSSELERWIPFSYAASWRVSVPPLVLFVSGVLLGAWQRYPEPAKALAGVVGLVVGIVLIDRSMSRNAGQFDGLMEILALVLGSGGLVMGFLLGEFIRVRQRRWRASR